jgi:hypothetical protein
LVTADSQTGEITLEAMALVYRRLLSQGESGITVLLEAKMTIHRFIPGRAGFCVESYITAGSTKSKVNASNITEAATKGTRTNLASKKVEEELGKRNERPHNRGTRKEMKISNST